MDKVLKKYVQQQINTISLGQTLRRIKREVSYYSSSFYTVIMRKSQQEPLVRIYQKRWLFKPREIGKVEIWKYPGLDPYVACVDIPVEECELLYKVEGILNQAGNFRHYRGKWKN